MKRRHLNIGQVQTTLAVILEQRVYMLQDAVDYTGGNYYALFVIEQNILS